MKQVIVIFLLFFALLIGYLFYSINTFGDRWFVTPYNPRLLNVRSKVSAGTIYDRKGVKMAYTQGDTRKYLNDAPWRKAVSHVVGETYGLTRGAETFFAKQLYGFSDNIGNRFDQLLTGENRRGSDIALTISAKLQTEIAAKIKTGACVVMNYQTGEILALVSTPGFDPTRLKNISDETQSTVLFNRATMGRYPPGSIFKVITAAGALENRDIGTVTCTGSLEIDGNTISCAGGKAHGEVDLQSAFDKSCNVYFSLLAQSLGDNTLLRLSQRFAFNDEFLFSDIIVYKSIYERANNVLNLSQAGFGQYNTLITPLHAAMIASAIANEGKMPTPKLLAREIAPNGTEKDVLVPKTYATPLSKNVANELKAMMLSAVENGTGKSAKIQGLAVCGKTGTAQFVNKQGKLSEHAWFIGFLNEEQYPYSVAVLVEGGGSGGSVAAPIAKIALQGAMNIQ